MKRCALHNLGCKVNEYETDAMKQQMAEAGYEIVPFEEEADIYIINTCSVTNIADRKSRQMIHKARKINPNAIVIAAGCYVQSGADKLIEEGCADIILGNNQKGNVPAAVAEWEKSHQTVTCLEDLSRQSDFEELHLSDRLDHTRAFVKIQDGCNQFCSYCIIPFTRGRVRSRKPDEVLKEVHDLVRKGYKEIVLTGIHISSYGLDFKTEESTREAGTADYMANVLSKEESRQTASEEADEATKNQSSEALRSRAGYDPYHTEPLLGLLQSLNEVDGLERIRLGSLEPRIITEDFVRRLSAMKKVCPHFHLSLQSGCDETLKRMNRHYTTAEYAESCRILRSFYEHPAITTDVITGFAGETEEEFAQTVKFLKDIKLYEIHVFPFSVRQGTRAEKMPGQNTEAVKKARSRILLDLTKAQSEEFRAYYKDREIEVLLEEKVEIDGRIYCIGFTKEYVKAAFPGEKWKLNEILTGHGEGLLDYDKVLAE